MIMQLIFVHGLGQTSTSWEDTISYLEQEHMVNCPDLFALCREYNELSYQNLYYAFETYCNENQEPIHLCGISLGAILAMDYTINYPKKVKSLVLIAPQYKMPYLYLKIQNLLFYFMSESSFKKLGLTKTDIIKLTNSMLDLNFKGNLQSISCPTSIICGTKDFANKKSSKMISHHISGANITFIEVAGHEVNVETPKELAQILNAFYYQFV